MKNAITYNEDAKMWVLPCGSKTRNPADLIGSERMKSFMETCKQSFDLVVLDCSADRAGDRFAHPRPTGRQGRLCRALGLDGTRIGAAIYKAAAARKTCRHGFQPGQ